MCRNQNAALTFTSCLLNISILLFLFEYFYFPHIIFGRSHETLYPSIYFSRWYFIPDISIRRCSRFQSGKYPCQKLFLHSAEFASQPPRQRTNRGWNRLGERRPLVLARRNFYFGCLERLIPRANVRSFDPRIKHGSYPVASGIANQPARLLGGFLLIKNLLDRYGKDSTIYQAYVAQQG